MIAQLAAIVAPVYLIVALGFWWAASGRRYDTELISDLITYVGAPCLVFASLTELEVDRGAMLEMAAAALLALSLLAGLGAAVLRLAGIPLQTYLSPIVFMNAGNMGLPLSLFAFGEEGLAFGVCFYAVAAIAHFTAGLWIWSGEVSARVLVRSPLAWSALAATAALALDAEVPGWLHNTVSLLGDFTIPLLQFTLGVSLGRLPFLGWQRGVALSLLRLGLGFAVGVGVAWAMGLEGTARAVFILDCSMPVAVFNYVLAERYRRSAPEIASLVVISTLLSFASVPALLAWLM